MSSSLSGFCPDTFAGGAPVGAAFAGGASVGAAFAGGASVGAAFAGGASVGAAFAGGIDVEFVVELIFEGILIYLFVEGVIVVEFVFTDFDDNENKSYPNTIIKTITETIIIIKIIIITILY